MAMQQSRLERENLEAHVDLCAERYRVLEENLKRLESKVDDLVDSMNDMSEKHAVDKNQNNKILMDKIKNIYNEHAEIPKKQLVEILKHDLWWDFEKCKSYGLIDEEWCRT